MDSENELALVFIHLGTHEAKWLLHNVLRTKQQFPSSKVLVVSDNDSLIIEYRKHDVETFRYEKTSLDLELEGNTKWDLSFRTRFWLETSRRFVALAAAQEWLKCPVLHVESDVTISPTLDLSAFRRLEKPLCFGLVSPGIGVGALVYSRDQEASQDLARFVIDRYTELPATNDMEILGAFAEQQHEQVSILPTAPRHDSNIFKSNTELEFRKATSELFNHFGGIFDVATIGQFLAGKDPRNHQGFREIYTVPSDHCVNPSAVKFRVGKDGNLVFSEEEYGPQVPILSLHVHSKDLRFFRPATDSRILSRRVRLYRGVPVREFSIWGFRETAYSYLSRRFNRISKLRTK